MTESRCRGRIAAGTLLIVFSATSALAGLVEGVDSAEPAVSSLTEFSIVAADSMESRTDAGLIADPTDVNVSALLSIWSPTDLDTPLDTPVAPVDLTVNPTLLAYAPAGSPVVITARDAQAGIDRVQGPPDQVGSAELDVGTGLSQVVVPEPSVLLLMLLGLPAVVRMRRTS